MNSKECSAPGKEGTVSLLRVHSLRDILVMYCSCNDGPLSASYSPCCMNLELNGELSSSKLNVYHTILAKDSQVSVLKKEEGLYHYNREASE